jgi:hypothetical protein
MSNNTSEFLEFLDILEDESNSTLKVQVSSKSKPINVIPLNFKQQKALVTSGMNGIVGTMSFIKNLNDIILLNSKDNDLKIYDRIPIVLAFRNKLSSKKLKKEDTEIGIESLISQFNKINIDESPEIAGSGFTITLKIPTLIEENRYLSNCIEDLKKIDNENLGKNVSLILSYEIPKFIDSIKFGDKTIKIDSLTIGEKNKIIDNLPADVTNNITEFILSVREYDEKLLTFEGTLFEIDYLFFE